MDQLPIDIRKYNISSLNNLSNKIYNKKILRDRAETRNFPLCVEENFTTERSEIFFSSSGHVMLYLLYKRQ